MGPASSLPYILRLYVTDASPKSARAIVNARRILETHLAGRYALEILDVATHVARAAEDQIVCAPTLLRAAPAPLRRIIGDMSDEARVLQGLGVRAQAAR
jgi:circadian clock protein KaiB